MDIRRLTEKVQESLGRAQQWARQESHSKIDTEHLLVALLEVTDGIAFALLEAA